MNREGTTMKFEEAHEAWLARHLARRKGERLSRLQRGHGHGEILFLRNVWWPLHRHFDHLHPEYEVLDVRGKSYFADFAYLRGPVRFLIEIKGFNSHVRDMDRVKYCHELNRETYLFGIGYPTISFAYDDVEQRPGICITLLRLVLDKLAASAAPTSPDIMIEKEIVRLAVSSAGVVRPIDVKRHLSVDYHTVFRALNRLCDKGVLDRIYGPDRVRVVKYELVGDAVGVLLS
jgi:hypothetical protein